MTLPPLADEEKKTNEEFDRCPTNLEAEHEIINVWGNGNDNRHSKNKSEKQRAYRRLYCPKDIIQLGELNWNLIKNDVTEHNPNPNNISSEAIDCLMCGSSVIAEYNAKLELITLYDFDSYYFTNQRILHSHSADTRTKNRVLERIRTERRLLSDMDPNDYHYRAGKEFVR